MIGLTTFVDNNFKQGIEIWEGLENYLKDKPELSDCSNKIKKLKSASYFLQSRFLFLNGQIPESLVYKNKLLSLVPNEYDKYLTEAIIQVNLRNDPELALDFVKKAENVAKEDGAWRYSKFYLLIRLSRCKEAIDTLDEIITNEYPAEIETINQVISYNLACLKEDKTHIQSHFIIGVLIYKKLNMPIPAYEKLEYFINASKNKDNWKELRDKAIEYIYEINKIIGIKLD